LALPLRIDYKIQNYLIFDMKNYAKYALSGILLFVVWLAPMAVFAQTHTTEPSTHQAGKQPTKPQPKKATDAPTFQRWYYGGNVNGGLLNGGFFLDISPQVGYRLTPHYSVGAGVVGLLINQNVLTNTGTLRNATFGTYGTRLFTRYEVGGFLRGLYAHGELEGLFHSRPDYIDLQNKIVYRTQFVPAAYAGLGYSLGTGALRLNVLALYNFLYETNPALYNTYQLNAYNFGPIVIRGGIGLSF
jgi:hypothetical protein